MNKPQQDYPLEFRKRDLAEAIERKTGTSLLYQNGRLMGDKLLRILFAEQKLIKQLGWTKDLYKGKYKFLGHEARILCRHLKLTKEHFV